MASKIRDLIDRFTRPKCRECHKNPPEADGFCSDACRKSFQEGMTFSM